MKLRLPTAARMNLPQQLRESWVIRNIATSMKMSISMGAKGLLRSLVHRFPAPAMPMGSVPRTSLMALCLSVMCGATAFAHQPLRIEYYVWGRHAKNGPPADARPIQAVDVLIFFAATGPDATSGRASLSSAAVTHLNSLKTVMNPKTELWLGVTDLSSLINQPAKIQGFADSVLELSKIHGFKGLDIDWEGETNVKDYASVVSPISDALRVGGFRISTGISIGPLYRAKAAATQNKVDWTNIQFYYSRFNAWTVDQMASELQEFRKLGVPASGIAIGLPAYGSRDAYSPSFNGAKDVGTLEIGYGMMLREGASSQANEWIRPTSGFTYYYSGVPLTRSKVRHALDGGYRGVFSWEMTIDAPYSSEDSILRAIDAEFAVPKP